MPTNPGPKKKCPACNTQITAEDKPVGLIPVPTELLSPQEIAASPGWWNGEFQPDRVPGGVVARVCSNCGNIYASKLA